MTTDKWTLQRRKGLARPISRRRVIQATGATLSGAAVGLLLGTPRAFAADSEEAGKAVQSDARILNTALAAEHEAVAAYQLGAESGLLKQDALKLALQFQGHHKAHVDLLASVVRELGGKPAEPKMAYGFPVEKLTNQEDVLSFAAGLEQGAVSAYLGAVPLFGRPDLAKAAASILGDEAMHWAVLRHILGLDPVPVAFVA